MMILIMVMKSDLLFMYVVQIMLLTIGTELQKHTYSHTSRFAVVVCDDSPKQPQPQSLLTSFNVVER